MFARRKQIKYSSLDYRSSKANKSACLFGNVNIFVFIDSTHQEHRAKNECQQREYYRHDNEHSFIVAYASERYETIRRYHGGNQS